MNDELRIFIQCRRIRNSSRRRARPNFTGQNLGGQGLLEAVIALGIIITGVVATLTFAIASLSAGVMKCLAG